MVNKEKKIFWEDCYNVNIPDEIRATISEESKTKILKATEAFADQSVWDFLQTNLGYKTRDDAVNDCRNWCKKHLIVSAFDVHKSPLDESKLEIEYTITIKEIRNDKRRVVLKKYTLLAEEDHL